MFEQQKIDAVLDQLHVNSQRGLSSKTAQELLEKKTVLTPFKRKSPKQNYRCFYRSFATP